jgi:hypothetical protein
MSKLENAVQAEVKVGERVQQRYEGLSDGLNRQMHNAGAALMLVTDHGVLAAWLKTGLLPKPVVERFELSDLIGVRESEDALPGLTGALERKNATKALGRAMGNASTRPTLTVQTRRGDFALFFKPNQRGDLRSAYLAIGDLAASR